MFFYTTIFVEICRKTEGTFLKSLKLGIKGTDLLKIYYKTEGTFLKSLKFGIKGTDLLKIYYFGDASKKGIFNL